MRSLALHAVILIFFMTIGIGHANDMSQPIAVEFRVVVNRADSLSRVRVINRTVPEVRLLGMNLYFSRASEPHANREWVNIYGIRGPIRIHTLKKGEHIERIPPRAPFIMQLWRNEYAIWKWEGELQEPPPGVIMEAPPVIHLGYVPAEGGELKPPYVDADSGAASNLLAFVFHQNIRGGLPLDDVPPNELAFLLLNGMDEPLEIAAPLSADSRLHISAPGIGFSAEITLSESGFEARTVEPGECGQWRIPFERILAQMPSETVAAIREADGALDVVWRAGDLESPPLPLILLPPTQAERDAAFLAEHADVPRIDENTDLSLDLRLAEIEREPVLLGRLLNNENHAVLWDDKSRQYSGIIPSYLQGYSFRLLRAAHGSRPHLISSDEMIELPFSVDKFLEGQRDKNQQTRKEATDGFILAASWNYYDKILNPIWLALPGERNQLSAIHAFDASWHTLTTFEVHQGKDLPKISEVPDLPPIAPILAYVYNPETPPELTSVLWNRTEEAINVTDSRIIASSPAADYRRELALPQGLNLPATVAPGAHTDWRIPWSAIMDQIPPNDLARIKVAGGELDLIWDVNGLDSPPLPILLGWDGKRE